MGGGLGGGEGGSGGTGQQPHVTGHASAMTAPALHVHERPEAMHVSPGLISWLPFSSMPPMKKPVSAHGGGATGGAGGGLGGVHSQSMTWYGHGRGSSRWS